MDSSLVLGISNIGIASSRQQANMDIMKWTKVLDIDDKQHPFLIQTKNMNRVSGVIV